MENTKAVIAPKEERARKGKIRLMQVENKKLEKSRKNFLRCTR